jgi:opacity protein-like surface antigen
MKRLILISVAALAASFAQASDVGGNDWNFNFTGNYSIANLNTSNDSLVSGLLGTTLNLDSQLNLISGTTSAVNQPVTITQSSLSNFQANPLWTTATAGPGLVSGLGAFVANALNLSNGPYNGVISGSNVTMTNATGTTLALNDLVDSRVLGTGVVLNLEAIVPNSSYTGSITGVDSGPSSPFGGGRVNTITGTAGVLDTINLEAEAITYVGGIATVNTGFVNVGAITNHSTSWALTRANSNSTPTPASGLALGAGLVGLAFRRKRASR